MTKKNYYAVKKGRQTGIFYTWSDCKKQVHKYKGAIYKGFATKKGALEYLSVIPSERGEEDEGSSEPSEQITAEQKLTAYVDGSFSIDTGMYAFGCVFIFPDGHVEKQNGAYSDELGAKSRNVSGEMQGALHAVDFAIEHGFKAVDIYYDYMGIEMWATRSWNANNALTKDYASKMMEAQKIIKISFHKVAAHTGVKYNELADMLAKEALGI